tara:strand:+ start:89730 stop:90578 length:849 start_codon:yes stop_codon:yes gene_type:complete
MILGNETNMIYFSSLIESDTRFNSSVDELKILLDKCHLSYKTLQGTKDIWCRDYMPIQVSENRYVQFRYEPSYLDIYDELRTIQKEVLEANNITAEFSDINLDGGNLVQHKEKVILTDRVFDENPEYTQTKLIDELEKLFDAQIIIIPQINNDTTGHADGMVRWANENTLIGNDRSMEYKYWSKGMDKVLKHHDLDYIDVPFFDYRDPKYPEHAIGCYMNFLEVGNLVVLPLFEIDIDFDERVLGIFKEAFYDRVIRTINYNEVGKYGGLLNCTTWTIKTKS